MADAQADNEIQKAERALSPEYQDVWDAEWAEEKTLTDPSRWWFASTACPLIAGTFGPMANAFNICALVQEWREKVPPQRLEGFGYLVTDPSYIIAINAVSLACALIANASLLLNMVGRVSFAIAQPITTIGFMVASLLLLAIVGVASSGVMHLEDLPPGYTQYHTQAFYYACFAAANYFLVSVLMNITVWGAVAGKYSKEFHITRSQRTLMLQTISFMAYLLAGAAIFSNIEGWRYNDAVYWADFTLLTIGIGDRFVPQTHAGRSLMIIYTFGGILAVGLVISSFRTMILEKGAEKLHARTAERRRQRVGSLADAEQSMPLIMRWLLPKRKVSTDPKGMTERDRREAEFYAMRNIQNRVEKINQYQALAISVFNAAMLWFLGALVFYKVEYQNWSYFEALYFSYTTLITLGYGDLQPKSNCGKAFFVFWTLLAIPTLTVLISDMGDTVVKAVADATNWVGSVTIIPGDADFFDSLQKKMNELTQGLLFRSGQSAPINEKEVAPNEEARGTTSSLDQMLNSRLSQSEKLAIDDYCKTSTETLENRDIHFYHFLIIKEVRNVLADTVTVPPKQYTFDEWAYFLRILGHNESDPAFHTQRYNSLQHGKRDDEKAPQVARILDHDGNPRHWSWLSLRSPLIGLNNEAEWILNRLLNKLQGELNFEGKPGRGIGEIPPPISLSKFRGHATAAQVNEYMEGVEGREIKMREATFG